MKIDILLGLQWGDEGKGKVVDVLTSKYDVIARFQGGPNAGHSLEFNGIRHVLHIIPSGIFHKEKMNIIGNGVVIDPIIFEEEIDDITLLMTILEFDVVFLSKSLSLFISLNCIEINTCILLDSVIHCKTSEWLAKVNLNTIV